MSSENKTQTCDECHNKFTEAAALIHAKMHWGEKLDRAAKANPEAKRRIEKLTGVEF